MTPGQALAQLSARAALYDLRDRGARARSAADLRKMFFALLPAVGPDLFAEAGAHDGSGARRARRLLPKARVVAYEGNPHNHARFPDVTISRRCRWSMCCRRCRTRKSRSPSRC